MREDGKIEERKKNTIIFILINIKCTYVLFL